MSNPNIGGRPLRRATAVALTLPLSYMIAGCSGSSATPRHSAAPTRSSASAACNPMTTELLGDSHADPNNRFTWSGVELTTRAPLADVIISWSFPGGSWRDSYPITPQDTLKGLAVEVGPNTIEVSIRYAAAAGSLACQTKPDTIFSAEESRADLPPGALDRVHFRD